MPKKAETPVVVEQVENTTTEPVKKTRKKAETPTAILKKRIKELEQENATLNLKLEQAHQYVMSVTEQKNKTEQAMNDLAVKYTRITEYIKKSLSVYHQSVLLAFEEEVK